MKTQQILATFLMLICYQMMSAQPYPESSYELNVGYRRLVKWTGPETDIDFTADPRLREYVEEIWDDAFEGNENIKSVKFSSTLTEIMPNAFLNCPNLETVEFSEVGYDFDHLSIQPCAFDKCPKLKSVILPKRLDYIWGDSFDECPALTTFKINSNHPLWRSYNGAIYTKEMDVIILFPQGVTGHLDLNSKVKIIDAAAFNRTALTSIYMPSVESIKQDAFQHAQNLTTVSFSNNLRSIGHGAFCPCPQLKSVILPSSLETLEYSAFARCESLPQTIKLPASLSQIDGSVFSQTPVNKFELAQGNPYFSTIDGVLFDASHTEFVAWPCGREDMDYSIPEGVSVIRIRAFDNSLLESIGFPSTLRVIEQEAFYRSNLKKIVLPEGFLSLDQYSFGRCTNLTEIILPSTLNNLESNTFFRFKSEPTPQRKVTCYADTPVGDWEENGVKNDILYVPEESVDIYKITPGWRGFGSINPIPKPVMYQVTYDEPQYGFLIISDLNGEIESGTEVKENTVLTVEAIAYNDYELTSVMANGVAIENNTSYTVTGPVHFTATFEPKYVPSYYEVTYDRPENGSLNISVDGTLVGNGTSVLENTVLKVNAVPATDYKLASLTANGVAIENNSSYTVSAPVHFTAIFEPLYVPNYYRVTYDDPEHGILAVSANGNGIESGVDVLENSVITVEAIALSNYELNSLSVNGKIIDNRSSFILTEPVHIQASFSVISGISDVVKSEPEVTEIFTVAGKKIDVQPRTNLNPGIYIIRTKEGKVVKTTIK